MPVSKGRKKPVRKRTPKPAKQSMRVMAAAGALVPLRMIQTTIDRWKKGEESAELNQGMIDGFFFTYDRVLKNAGIPFDIKPALQVLNRIHYKMPIGLDELELLYEEGRKLARLVGTARDVNFFVQAIQDAEIYGHLHKWEWHGIGEAPAGSSASA